MSIIQKIALALTVLGAINWGLVGIFEFNLVSYLFGELTVVSRIIYIVIALAGLFNIALFFIENKHKLIDMD